MSTPREFLFLHFSYAYHRISGVLRASNYLRHPKSGRRYLTELYGLIASGFLKAVVSTEYPLTAEGVAHGQRDQSEGKSIGKILIKVA